MITSLDDIYFRFEEGYSEVEKLRLTKPELEDYLLKTIIKTLGSTKASKLHKTADLFAFGVDSLQGTRVRNMCQKELDLGNHVLGQNGMSLIVAILFVLSERLP